MTRYVVFLRAINVGNRRVKMAQLCAELEALGLAEVSTYIASGNAIFTSPSRAATLEPLIEERLEAAFGWLSEAFVRSADQVVEIAARSPFGTISPDTTHLVAMLRSAPTTAEARAIEAMSGDRDQLVVINSEVHWHIAGKSMDTELKPRDWKATVAALNTTRNMTMMTKLADRLDS